LFDWQNNENPPARPRSRWLLLMGLVLVGLPACAHSSRGLDRRLALLPVDAVGLSHDEGLALHRSLRQALARRERLQLTSDVALSQALSLGQINLARCQATDPCLAALGRRLQAELLLSVALAGLGDVRLVRSRLFAVNQGIALHDLQQTTGRSPQQLKQYADELSRRLFPDELRRPWYKQWWLWAAAATVVGVTAGVTWYVTRDPPRDSEVVHLGEL
jgi:hypothetical protein